MLSLSSQFTGRGLVVLALLAALACGRKAPAEPEPEAPAAGTTALHATADIIPQDDPQRLSEAAYTFGYPLVLMDVTRRVMTAQTPMNSFHHLRRFPDASFKDVVSPNADTLYSSAWLDLGPEPQILSLPDTGERYYLMPMLDAWTNVFASPGTRTTGNRAGDYAIVGPDWRGELPANVTVIRAPTNMVWIIGRTRTEGEADFAAVAQLQDQYRLTPLSAWGRPATVTPPAPSHAAVDTATPPVQQVARMDADSFYARLAELLPANPPAPADAPMMAKLRALGISAGSSFAPTTLTPAVKRAREQGARVALANIVAAGKDPPGEAVNGWKILRDLGQYGTDYDRRALVAFFGLGANLPQDAIYPSTHVDGEGQPLSGANHYVLHFAADQVPPVHGFWSLTMYNNHQFFVPNPIGRYAIGDRHKLKYNQDGSLDVHIQHESPGAARESNWLPAPAGAFNLMLRLYWPQPSVLGGTWTPPPVRKVP